MKIKSKEKLRNGLIISAVVVVVALVIVLYAIFMQASIYEESSNHLSEVYGQTNSLLQQRITSHRNVMKSWEAYIKSTANNPDKKKEFENFINEQKSALNVTSFSFINDSELYDDDKDNQTVYAKDRDGRVYGLELRRDPTLLFGKDDVGVACMRKYIDGTGMRVEIDGEVLAEEGKPRVNYNPDDRFIMIAVRYTGENSYTAYDGDKPFTYSAIAFFFDADAISYAISVDDVFEKQASCFLVLPSGLQDDSTGLVILQSIGKNDKLFNKNSGEQLNFLQFLRTKTKLQNYEVDGLRDKWQALDIKDTKGYTTTFRANNGTQYYLNYRTISFSDWIMVGVVPVDIVNESMTNLRTITIIVMAAIFVVLGGGVAWFIIMSNKRKMRDKELAIKSREGLFDLLTANTKDIFALFDARTGAAEYVSKNVQTVLGLDVDEVKQDVFKILTSSNETVNELKKHYASENLSESYAIEELPMKNVKDGTEYWFRLGVNASQHRGSSRQVLMLSDRTKERQMRADLEEALQIAKSANEAKSNFLSNMSHDIRTPMNAIIGFATLLEKDVENPEKVREYIRKISFSSHHMLSLINDILDMSKIESGKSTIHIAEFSFPELLEELYSIIINQVQSKKQTFEMHTKGNIPELVYGDKMRLNQVMLNLLSNAVKYTPAGGNIELSVEALKESVHNHAHLRLSVKDNGLGMSEDFVKVIFEPFSRETTAATREIQGTGLGMAITKQIIDLMGGTITVKSKRGKGSEFIVELELAKVIQTYGDAKEFWVQHNIKNLLVVDDDSDVCIEVKELMRDTGVTVDYCMSGKEALKKIEAMKGGSVKYDVVVLDWKMPEMDGLETAKRIRAITGDVLPIMFLSSYNYEDIEDEAKKAGIHAFLPKPFFVSNFRNAVAKLNDEEEVNTAEAEEEISMEGLNILCAEDNPINAEILEELLDIEGATCKICENGKLAFEEFEKSKPGTYDMIFMDVQMPVMNGHEASRAIRACSHPEAQTIPIIAMTANAFDDDKKMAHDAGMNAHVAKPIDMNIVKKTVAKLLGGHHE